MKVILRTLAIIGGLFFLMMVGLVVWSAVHTGSLPKATVLHVVLDGPLAETPKPSLAGLVGGRMHTTLRSLTQGIRRAASDERIVGLVLDIRTPSVGLAQVAEVQAAMADFRASGKWNVAFLETAGEMGHGDGAFALASTAKEVVLSPPGEVNLNGLRSEVPFIKTALERFHIGVYADRRYEYKDFPNTFTQNDFTPEHKESLKTLLDDLQQHLLTLIGESRGAKPEEVRQWVENAPWASEDAVKSHLVDRLGYWDDVEAEAVKLAGRDDPFADIETYVERLGLNPGSNEVALIVASGMINMGDSGKGPMQTTDGVGSNTLTQAFRDARKNAVKGVLFRVDSQGGSYIASDLIRREVELTRKAGIPVVVSMGNVAASGGYFISADADYIIAEPGTITGSIGVFTASFALRDFLQHWLGVNFGVYETIPHPGNISWLDTPSPADRERLGKTLDRIYRDFVTKVAAGRHKTYEQVHAVAKGRVWTGKQALQNGLVDELGGVETAVAYLRKRLELQEHDTLRLQYYPEPDSPLDMLRDLLSNDSPHMGVLSLDALLKSAQTFPGLLAAPWAQWGGAAYTLD